MAKEAQLIDRRGKLFNYLTPEQRGLVFDCEKLIQQAKERPQEISDYSYIVFPLAKMYEGFLKKLLLDLGIINHEQYVSDHFRIGKALNPNLPQHLKLESVYDRVCTHFEGDFIANSLWQEWKKGRNLLFHYFPHDLHRIDFLEAQKIARSMISVMEIAVAHSGRRAK